MKCMNNERQEAYQVKKILKMLKETLRIKIWSEMRLFGREKERAIERERSNEMRVR